MQTVAADITDPAEFNAVEREIRELLAGQRNLLEQAAGTYTSYLRALGDLDIAQRRLLDVADEYKQFLDQNLLWIPSTSHVGVDTLKDVFPAIRWALAPDSWLEVAEATVTLAEDETVYFLLGIVLILLSVAALWPLKRRYVSLNKNVGRLSTDSIWMTLESLVIVFVRAAPLPLAFMLFGYALLRHWARPRRRG